jgi:outer membrane protein TolC
LLRSLSLLLLLPTGCTPSVYRDWADRDVRELLRERTERVQGYDPQVLARTTVQATPSRTAYEKLPVTARARDEVPRPLEPVSDDLPLAPLGPVIREKGPGSVVLQMFSTQSAREYIDERLRYGPAVTVRPRHKLDLFGVLSYGTRHSRRYLERMEDLYLAALDVTLERHLFEPRFFAGGSLRYNGAQADGNYASALTAVANAGVRQKLPYGGEVVASALVNFVNALNGNVANGESATLALSATIPLLRGAGWVNLESLISSERNLVYETRRFEEFRRQFAVDLATEYFRLVSRQQRIINRYLNYMRFVELTERTAALFAAGRITALEVQRSLQSQLQAEDALNSALEGYASDIDNFKIALGMPMEEELVIVPSDVVVSAPSLSERDAIALAQKYRLDLQTARDRVDDARRAVENAKNGLLPELDLELDGSVGNADGTPAVEITGDSARYSARLNLDLPVDRVSERNAFRRALINLERRARAMEEQSDVVSAEVRRAQRGVRASELSLRIQMRNIEVALQRLDFANESLLAGRSNDSRNVVEAQNALLNAQDAYDSARADQQIRLLQFLNDTGLLRVDPDAGSLGSAMALPREDELFRQVPPGRISR